MPYTPTPSENIATGIVGILIFLALNVFSILSLRLSWHRGVSKLTKKFFMCILVMSNLEMPRYCFLTSQGAYTSKLGYCLHILGGIFFFAAFSIVCRQWSGLLRLGSYFKGLYGNQGLLLSNIFFACIDILGIITCSLSPTLQSFFASTPFAVLTFIEGMRNILYSSFLSFYGLKLVSRFWHFSQLERHRGSTRFLRSNSSMLDLCDFLRTLQVDSSESVFKIVVVRVTVVLLLCSLCFVSRVIMLSMKMDALHDTSAAVTAQGFSLFGLLWFTFSDFIPRALPSAVCLLLLTLRKPGSRSSQSANAMQESSSNEIKQPTVTPHITPGKKVGRYTSRIHETNQKDGDMAFQFVRLTGDEMDLEYDAVSPINGDGRGDRQMQTPDAFSTDAAPPLAIHTPAYSPLDNYDRIDSDLKKGILNSDLFMEESGGTSPLAAESGRSLLWTGDLDEDEDEEDESDDFSTIVGGQRRTLDRLLSMLARSGERQPLDIEQTNRSDSPAAQKNTTGWNWGHS